MNIESIISQLVAKKFEIRVRADLLNGHPLIRVEVYEGESIKVAASGVLLENALQVLAQVLGIAPGEALSDSAGRKVPVFVRRRPGSDVIDDTADNYDSDGRP